MRDPGSFWCSKYCQFIPPGGELDDVSGMLALLFIWKEAVQYRISFRAQEIHKQKAVSLSRLSSVFLADITPKTFSFYSLASISLCTFVVFLHLLTVLVSLRHIQTHTQTSTYMYLHISFLWRCQMYAFRPKTLQLPRWLPSPVFLQIVCKRVSSAGAAIYFRKELGFPFTWVQEQDKYCKMPQRCARSVVAIWGRWDQGTAGQCLLQRSKEQGRGCRQTPSCFTHHLGLPCRQHKCAHK